MWVRVLLLVFVSGDNDEYLKNVDDYILICYDYNVRIILWVLKFLYVYLVG